MSERRIGFVLALACVAAYSGFFWITDSLSGPSFSSLPVAAQLSSFVLAIACNLAGAATLICGLLVQPDPPTDTEAPKEQETK